jgi:hypothetical protein
MLRKMDWKYVRRTSGMLTCKPLERMTSSVALSLVWRMKARWPSSTGPFMVESQLEETLGTS